MEMLDVDNWDNDVEFSRSAESPFRALAQSRGLQGGERFLHFLASRKAFAEEKEYDLILSNVALADSRGGFRYHRRIPQAEAGPGDCLNQFPLPG